jgi:RNA polymerase sigma factor (sigma-70 family)
LLPHLDAAYTLARHLTHNPQDADDAVQEAYLRAARYFHTLLEGDNGRAWLLTIVRRECLPTIARRRADQMVPLDEPSLHLVDGHPLPDAEAFRAITRERIMAIVEELPPDLRETLVLREISDCSYRDIATITSVPIGTVMSRLARARIRVAAQLRPFMSVEEMA